MESPFPYAWLPRFTRAEASQATAIARAVQPIRSLVSARNLLAPRWEALLGGRVEAWPGVPEVLGREAVNARFGGVSVAAVMHHGVFRPIAVIVDAPLALTLAARALGADEPGARRASATRSFGAAQEGALAMLCAQAATLVCAPSPPPIVRGVTERIPDVTAAIGAETLLVWSWRISAGIEAGEASLVMDARALRAQGSAPLRPWEQLMEIEVPIALGIARASLPLHEIAKLGIGDVVLTDLDASALDDGLDPSTCMLSLGPAEVPVSLDGEEITFAKPGRTTRRQKMPANDDGNEPREPVMRTDVLASVPVDVDVVIARTALPLAEIAAWRVGEVMVFPSRIGELVEVRAGGRTVARGELCDVDGQLGVRVTELL